MRLIDADRINIHDVSPAYGFVVMGVTEEDIDLEPTIDAVPVVRCKDCKYFVSDMEWCEADDEHPASPDAFCSWAERRSDE